MDNVIAVDIVVREKMKTGLLRNRRTALPGVASIQFKVSFTSTRLRKLAVSGDRYLIKQNNAPGQELAVFIHDCRKMAGRTRVRLHHEGS